MMSLQYRERKYKYAGFADLLMEILKSIYLFYSVPDFLVTKLIHSHALLGRKRGNFHLK